MSGEEGGTEKVERQTQWWLSLFCYVSFCSVLPVRLQTGLEGKLIWLDLTVLLKDISQLMVMIFLYFLCGSCSTVPFSFLPVFSLGNYTHLPWMTEDHFLFAKECREASRNWVRSKPCFFFLPQIVLFRCTFWANPRQVVYLLDSLHEAENMVYKGISVGVSKILYIWLPKFCSPLPPLFNFIKRWQAMLIKSHWLLLNKPTEWAGAQSIIDGWWVTRKPWCGGRLGRKWSL